MMISCVEVASCRDSERMISSTGIGSADARSQAKPDPWQKERWMSGHGGSLGWFVHSQLLNALWSKAFIDLWQGHHPCWEQTLLKCVACENEIVRAYPVTYFPVSVSVYVQKCKWRVCAHPGWRLPRPQRTSRNLGWSCPLPCAHKYSNICFAHQSDEPYSVAHIHS